MHWPPDVFWSATPHEFFAAMEVAYSRTDEGKRKARQQEFADFKAKLEQAGVA